MIMHSVRWYSLFLLLVYSATATGTPTGDMNSNSGSANHAESIYKLGIDHFDAGEYQLALKEFREAYAIKSSWKLLYNIGQSAAAAGEYGIALESFQHYLVGGQEQLSMERINQVTEEINRLKIVVGYIEVKTAVPGTIYVDGYDRGKTPLAGVLPVTSGVRTLELKSSSGDEVIFHQEVSVVGEQTVVITFDEKENAPDVAVIAGANSATTSGSTNAETSSVTTDTAAVDNSIATMTAGANASSPKTDAPKSASLAPGVVLLSVGLAGLGVGTGFVVKNIREQRLAEDSEDLEYRDTYNNKVRPMNNVGAATAYAVGTISLTVGIVLLVKARQRRQQSKVSRIEIAPSAGGIAVSF